MARRGWVEVQKGSGVFVRAIEEEAPLEGDLELDRLVRQFIERAREEGFSLLEIRSRVAHWLESHPPDHYLLIEADPELRRILQHEISCKNRRPCRSRRTRRLPGTRLLLVGAAVVALYGKGAAIGSALPPGYPCLWLRSRSVEDELSTSLGLFPREVHLAVVSRWPDFINWARTILLAAGLDPDVLSFHDARRKGWEKALSVATILVADSLLSSQLKPAHSSRCYTFSLLPDSSLDELREHAQQILFQSRAKTPRSSLQRGDPTSRR